MNDELGEQAGGKSGAEAHAGSGGQGKEGGEWKERKGRKERERREEEFSRRIKAGAGRKLRARWTRNQEIETVWSGLGMIGLVGWGVSVPILLGAALGIWLDRRFPGEHSWTLTLLFAGLFVGCLNAWRWIAREERLTRRKEEAGAHEAQEKEDDS
jgi:ATP synthase protein I